MVQKKTSTTQKELIKIVAELPIHNYLSYQEFLNSLYEIAKNSIPKYTLKKFTIDLGFPDSNLLWLISSGRRKLTKNTLKKITDALKIKKLDKDYLQTLMEYSNSTNPALREELFAKLVQLRIKSATTPDQQRLLEYFSEWFHPVIRELATLEGFVPDPAWINQRLKIKLRPLQIKKSLELLGRLGFVELHKEAGETKQIEKSIIASQMKTEIGLIRYHQKMCEIARDSLPKTAEENRDFNTLTISISQKNKEKINDLIQNFCLKVLEIDEQEENSEDVFQLNLQLFPLTELKKGTKK